MESFASNIAQIVFEKLASRAYEEIHIALSVKVELNKLEETLSSITLLLLDAEEKQMNNRVLTEWLGKLKDVCYDIDDELDDFAFKQLRMQVLIRGSVAGKVCHLFSRWNSLVFPIYTGHKIKQIRARLNEIAAAKDQFHLKERAGEWHGLHMNRETYSFVQLSDVIGRDNDKEHIIIHLLKDTDHADQNVSVISIAGLGGLGKTTLAKLVYNDSAVVRNFDLRMWVCVSYDFDNKSLVRKIIGSATNQKCEEDSFENLAIKLQNELKDTKFLLVLVC
ncbi:putative P-loop containing nucleoside triphosphate hydrolase [Rosa chinensis]|uniref:Putative P-loop containing nucleoside triphosphate hydrolase n=1 Tax=Rosa chinensis TaxID=74649 RepID=A0A2P6Q486_ROSCH|nr:putative P-loop containing nucleoside triphosphate hydrolase [Rosa chinensis]